MAHKRCGWKNRTAGYAWSILDIIKIIFHKWTSHALKGRTWTTINSLKEIWLWLLIQQTSVHIFKRSCLNLREYIILSGKAQPKMQFWCGQWECYGIGAQFRLGVSSLISASMFNGLTKRLVKIAKNRTEKQIKVRFLFQFLLFLHHDNGFRTYR